MHISHETRICRGTHIGRINHFLASLSQALNYRGFNKRIGARRFSGVNQFLDSDCNRIV